MLERAEDDLRLPMSAYAECLVGPARRGRLAQARSRIAALQLRLEPLTESVAERAAELRARFRALGLPDVMVIATGEILGADAIVTSDAAWRRVGSWIHVLS